MTCDLIPVTGSAHSASRFDDIFDAILRAVGYDPATQGVLRANAWGLNTLAVSGTSSPVSIATGAAVVNGKLFRVTAAETEAIATPSVSTRIDRIVLQIDYTATPEAASIERVAGVEGGAAPAVTQTDGTTWQISLAQCSITTGGVITVTDERAYLGDGVLEASAAGRARMADGFFDAATALAKFAADSLTNAVLLDAIQDGAFVADAATRALFADGFINAAKIADRTRTVFIPATRGYVTNTSNPIHGSDERGWELDDGVLTLVLGDWYVPADYVSGLTIVAVVQCDGASGNIYGKLDTYMGADDQAYNTHNDATGYSAVAATEALNEILSVNVSSVAAGDYVTCRLARNATSGTDTFNSGKVFLKGFRASYTADS